MADATERVWHSLATDATGDVVVAGEAGGGSLHVSRDGGATWTAGDSPAGIWISTASSGTGSRLYAVQYGGTAYLSTDYGTTWTALASGTASWEGIASSQDGTKLAAVAQDGPLKLSGNGGTSWSIKAMPDSQANHWWRSVAMSSDGSVIVAVAHTGEMFRSTDGGTTWEGVSVTVGTTAVSTAAGCTTACESWYRVKTSADGQTIAAVGNSFGTAPGTGIYVSRDGGATWSLGSDLVADYTFLAMSSDGKTIAATVSDANSTTSSAAPKGRVLLSTDQGASFTQLTMPGTSTDWRAIAISGTGTPAYAATGSFATNTPGLLYKGQ